MPKLVLGDSLSKRIGKIKDCENFSRKGKTFSGMTDFVINNNVDVRERLAILIALGTNDISQALVRRRNTQREMFYVGRPRKPLITVEHIIEAFKCLVYEIRQRNRTAKLLFSAIIPRPTEYYESEPMIRQVNKGIEHVCEEYGMIFLYTYTFFCKGGLPVKGFYADNDDLHLSDGGSGRLTHCFRMSLAKSHLANPVKRKKRDKKCKSKRARSNSLVHIL